MKLRVYIKTFNKTLMMETLDKLIKLSLSLNIEVKKGNVLPVKKRKYCVLRSPHIDKNSREHFEIQIYKSFFDIILSSDNISILEQFLKLEISPGAYCYFKIIY